MDTLRSEHPRDGEPDLEALRAEIDALDSALADILAARFRAAETVGRLKGREGILATDPARETEIVRRATAV
ncbi:MAG: chorismate mutase, partial [Longimicrobiales bacterium]|nr:chorismate mutase [Longimicrobiales bacterium]